MILFYSAQEINLYNYMQRDLVYIQKTKHFLSILDFVTRCCVVLQFGGKHLNSTQSASRLITYLNLSSNSTSNSHHVGK